MTRAALLLLAGISLAIGTRAGATTSTASAAIPMDDTITWLCCYYTCSTNGGPSHPTSFCHPSSIGTECPATPAPSEDSEVCVLEIQRPAENCEECVVP
jgi:hypothetical protein